MAGIEQGLLAEGPTAAGARKIMRGKFCEVPGAAHSRVIVGTEAAGQPAEVVRSVQQIAPCGLSPASVWVIDLAPRSARSWQIWVHVSVVDRDEPGALEVQYL